jgi:hypothetical protein
MGCVALWRARAFDHGHQLRPGARGGGGWSGCWCRRLWAMMQHSSCCMFGQGKSISRYAEGRDRDWEEREKLRLTVMIGIERGSSQVLWSSNDGFRHLCCDLSRGTKGRGERGSWAFYRRRITCWGGLGFGQIEIGRSGQCRTRPGLLSEVEEDPNRWGPALVRERGVRTVSVRARGGPWARSVSGPNSFPAAFSSFLNSFSFFVFLISICFRYFAYLIQFNPISKSSKNLQ